MRRSSGTWALILAAGNGTRLSALSVDASGRAVPKQYCSLDGAASLLQTTIARAQSIAGRERTSLIVADAHRRWWWQASQSLPAANVVAQPHNCGTANGLLLQLLLVAEQDPEAEVVLLPADHLVADEQVLAQAVRQALAHVRAARSEPVLLGMTPSEPDPELGYIVPGMPDGCGAHTVRTFVDKPSRAEAERLIGRGALLNAFIMVARCDTLLGMYAQALPEVLQAMQRALDCRNDRRKELAELYQRLPVLEFSRQVLEAVDKQALRVIPVPECGWINLNTPHRLAEALSRNSYPEPQFHRECTEGGAAAPGFNYQRAADGPPANPRAAAAG
jgi:mannose-1-phosphate guanylyltransferase